MLRIDHELDIKLESIKLKLFGRNLKLTSMDVAVRFIPARIGFIMCYGSAEEG